MTERGGTLASAAYLIGVNNVKNYSAKGDKRLERAKRLKIWIQSASFGYDNMHRT